MRPLRQRALDTPTAFPRRDPLAYILFSTITGVGVIEVVFKGSRPLRGDVRGGSRGKSFGAQSEYMGETEKMSFGQDPVT